MQSLSLGSEATPPTTPTKRGTFNFMSPTKVQFLLNHTLSEQILSTYI